MKFEKYNILLLNVILIMIISSFIITNNSYSKYTIEEKILIGIVEIIKEDNAKDEEKKQENIS